VKLVAALAASLLLLLPSAPVRAQEPREQQERIAEAENELHRAIELAGNDRAALVRNLEDYLRRFPEAPRRLQVYRALVEAALQLGDRDRAADYAERIIAIRPDDSAMLLLAVDLLEQRGDAHSLTRAVGYVTRVLDRVEKSPVPAHPAAPEEERVEAERLLMSAYLIRGRLEVERRNYDAARADLEASVRLAPTPAAAVRLGDLAELAGDYRAALEHFTTAFVLPDHHGLGIDRREVRRKLGNAWRMLRGTEDGLGEHILAAYDRVYDEEEAGRQTSTRNPGAAVLGDFRLPRVSGGELAMAEMEGKVPVLWFWTTWSLPALELRPVVEEVARRFEAREDVVFLAVSADVDEEQVAPLLARRRFELPVVFAGGLDTFFGIRAIPTVLVLGRDGRVIFRAEGYAPATLAADLDNAIRYALAVRP
jgi:tetratricopeptide (TPR) repeat protein